MAITEAPSILIGEYQPQNFAPYTPSLSEARTKAVLFSGSYLLDGLHPDIELPMVSKEDVLRADDMYSQKVRLNDTSGVTLSDEQDQRLKMWEYLGIQSDKLNLQLGETALIRTVVSPDLIKPLVMRQLTLERKAARVILELNP